MIFIFTYWIFTWFILYITNILPYNPIFYIIIGYIISLFEFYYLIIKKTNNYNLTKFFIINVFLKLIPLLILILLNKYTFNLIDIYFGFFVFTIYLFVMYIFNENPLTEYNKLLNTYIKDDDIYKSFISKIYDYIFLLMVVK